MSRFIVPLPRLADRALKAGGHFEGSSKCVFLDRHGNCRSPVLLYNRVVDPRDECEWGTAVSGMGGEYRKIVEHQTTDVAMRVRCRKCPECSKSAAEDWARRATIEFEQWPRTWFGTLTYDPVQMQNDLEWSHDPVMGLPESDRERRRVEGIVLSCEAQKFWKRLRAAGHRLRYLQTTEQHKSGALHYHLMIHCEHTLTKRTLEAQWVSGLSHFRLARTHHACWYVAKYIGKGLDYRVRASKRYGLPNPLDVSLRPLDISEQET